MKKSSEVIGCFLQSS